VVCSLCELIFTIAPDTPKNDGFKSDQMGKGSIIAILSSHCHQKYHRIAACNLIAFFNHEFYHRNKNPGWILLFSYWICLILVIFKHIWSSSTAIICLKTQKYLFQTYKPQKCSFKFIWKMVLIWINITKSKTEALMQFWMQVII